MSIDNIKRSLYAIRSKGKFEKSKMKATYDGDYDPPKEKHVQSQNLETSPEQAFSSLSQRLICSHWTTALKTEMILHRGVEQVGPAFAAKLADLNIPMQNFDDPSERGSAHSPLIQRYFKYIRAKAQSHSRRQSVMMAPTENRAKYFNRLDPETLVKETSSLLDQLGLLVQLGPLCHKAIRNYQLKVTQQSAALLLKDASPLYQTVELGMERVLDQFPTFERPLATRAIEMVKQEHWCSGMLAKFFEVCRMLPYSDIKPPPLVNRPREVLQSMMAHLNEEAGDEIAALPPDEVEMQRRILEEFETLRAQKPPPVEDSVFISEPIPQADPKPAYSAPYPQFEAPPQPSKVDLIMSAYSQPPPSQSPMQPSMQPMQPMMMPMMNPYMAMMTNQVSATQMMANQMMSGMMQQPQFGQGMPQGSNLRSYNPFETGNAQGVPPRTDQSKGNPFF